jgi:2-polyprenyl-3-methyl-5-hydroxy-6-metoxy-1,4-benzoquinol methylase
MVTVREGHAMAGEYRCRICCCEDIRERIVAIEMMYGTKNPFEYDVCAGCGSIQISRILDAGELSQYYPNDYCDIDYDEDPIIRIKGAKRNPAALGYFNFYGAIGNRLRPWPGDNDLVKFKILGTIGIRFETSILDVGCGDTAKLLRKLKDCGFMNLKGCDPFLKDGIITPDGISVLKCDISQIKDCYDLIMFHHSFEHVPFPRETLAAVRGHLNPGGRCLIRIPTPSCEAFRIYGTDWVQFDAPRHLSLISRDGMKIMANQLGFKVARVVDDSSRFQFTASELYRRGVPLRIQKPDQAFSADCIKDFDSRAKELNRQHLGDQAAFVLEIA